MPQPMPCSVVILTKDSAATLDSCIQSCLEIASEIVLVDDFSADSTLSIAAKFNARVFKRKLESFGIQKQFAVDQATHDWIFLLDSDEETTPSLIQEIKTILSQSDAASAYKIPRKNFYLGKFLNYGGKYPDFQTRLFKKSLCSFSKDIVHEKVIVNGSVKKLSSDILHTTYPTMEIWLKKLELFARKNSEKMKEMGTIPSFPNFLNYCVLRPGVRFLRRYLLKAGFLDGFPGFLACIHDALTEILSYSFLTRMENKK